ncbi:MAG: hypothetical protein V4687_02155 [Bacteroidota bacterium]
MNTPPKDKPVRKDKDDSAELDDLQTDEAVAAPDSEIIPADNQPAPSDDNQAQDDLNIDNTKVGLNSEDQDEFL